MKLVSDTFYPEPTPISFKDKENIVPLDFTRQEICTLEQKNKKDFVADSSFSGVIGSKTMLTHRGDLKI